MAISADGRAKCLTCAYMSEKLTAFGGGECRRHPPVVQVTGDTRFPHISPTDWCGEHRFALTPARGQ